MKYVKKIPPADPKLKDSLINDGWKQVKEPRSLFTAILCSVPFMVINGIICYAVIALVDPQQAAAIRNFLFQDSWSLTIRLDHILFLYLLLVFHEAIHLVLVPNFIKSEKTFFGIKPWGGFVYTKEQIKKGRFMIIGLAPFFIISIIIPAILGLLGLLSGFIVFLALLNAIASSVDMLNTILLVQVPKGSTIVGNGFESYYRSLAESPRF